MINFWYFLIFGRFLYDQYTKPMLIIKQFTHILIKENCTNENRQCCYLEISKMVLFRSKKLPQTSAVKVVRSTLYLTGDGHSHIHVGLEWNEKKTNKLES